MTTIGQRITELRTAHGMTPGDFAAQIGTDSATTLRLENANARSGIPDELLRRVCRLFKLSLPQLLAGTDMLERYDIISHERGYLTTLEDKRTAKRRSVFLPDDWRPTNDARRTERPPGRPGGAGKAPGDT